MILSYFQIDYPGQGYNGGYRPQGNYGGGLNNQFQPSAPMPPPNYNPYGSPPAPSNYNQYGGPPPPHNQPQGFPAPANYNQYGGPPPPNYNSYGCPPPPPPNYNSYGGPPPPNYNSFGGPPPPTNYGSPLNHPVPSNYNSYPDQYGGSGQSSSVHPPKSGGLINKLEKLVHMDLNHDGTIGGKPTNSTRHKH